MEYQRESFSLRCIYLDASNFLSLVTVAFESFHKHIRFHFDPCHILLVSSGALLGNRQTIRSKTGEFQLQAINSFWFAKDPPKVQKGDLKPCIARSRRSNLPCTCPTHELEKCSENYQHSYKLPIQSPKAAFGGKQFFQRRQSNLIKQELGRVTQRDSVNLKLTFSASFRQSQCRRQSHQCKMSDPRFFPDILE